jgi:hypothetical protein
MLAKLDPYPAAIMSAKYDVLAYNRAYSKLIVDLDAIPVEDRNCLWLAFTNPQWRSAVLDWEVGVERMVANMRTLMADHVGDPGWKCLVNRLTEASPEFAALWARHDVRAIENKSKRVQHPRAGLLTFQTTNTWLAPRLGGRMIVYLPADERTHEQVSVLAE